MKQYIFLFLFSCVWASTANADGIVKLHGRIHAPVSDSIYITYNNSRLTYDPVQQGILLNRDGSFSTTFSVSERFTPVILKHGGMKADLVVEPGYDLELGAEGKKFDSSLHYKGYGHEVAGFAAQHTMDRGLMENYLLKMQPRFGDTAATFKKEIEALEQEEVLYLNNHMSGLRTDFVQFWVTYYHFFSYFALLQYPLLHEMAKQKTYYVKQVSPANYESISDIVDLFSDSLLGVPTYRMYVDQLYKMRMNAAGFVNMPNDPDEAKRYQQDDSVMYMAIAHMPPLTAQYAVANILYANARVYPLARTEHQLEMYKGRWPDSRYITLIQRQIAIMKRLAKGQKAMDFEINTPQGAHTKLSELKGKVILLTFWSSAYEQGMADLYIVNKLFNKFNENGVAFVFVSIDGNDQVWKTSIEKYRLSGIHTHVDGWKSLLAELYGIQAVPTFFLIDKQGNFATDPGHVPLPRLGDALSNELSRLLKE